MRNCLITVLTFVVAGGDTSTSSSESADDALEQYDLPSKHPNAPGMTTFNVVDGSHCTDLAPLMLAGTLLGDFHTRKQFHDLATSWLAQ